MIALTLVAACGARAVEPRQAAPPAPVPATPRSVEASEVSVTETKPPDDPSPGLDVRRDVHYPPDAAVDIAAWLTAHGVTTTLREAQCWDAGDRVGVPTRPGLLCISTSLRPERAVATLHRVEDGRTRLVWEGVVGTYANWLELTPLLTPDGSRLDVHERNPGDCDNALNEYLAKQESGVRADFGAVLEEGCRTRGTYVFSEGAYVRGHLR